MKKSYKAYQKATRTVSKTRQVVMLYQGVLRSLQQAQDAIEQKDVPRRYNALMRASEIIIGLQMSLDFDSGRDSAQALYDFYSQLDTRIMQLQRSQSLEECEALIEDVRQMHDVWDKIDRGEVQMQGQVDASAGTKVAQPAPAAPIDDAPEEAQSAPQAAAPTIFSA